MNKTPMILMLVLLMPMIASAALTVDILNPPNRTLIQKYTTFTIGSYVSCTTTNCGTVDVYPSYSTSGNTINANITDVSTGLNLIPLEACYQESFNSKTTTDTECGQSYDGTYNTNYAVDNFIDGNWSSTMAIPTGLALYINYTKPLGAVNATWKFIIGSTFYKEIPYECFNLGTEIELLVDKSAGGVAKCKNFTGWQTLQITGGGSFTEEAMLWNFTGQTTKRNLDAGESFSAWWLVNYTDAASSYHYVEAGANSTVTGNVNSEDRYVANRLSVYPGNDDWTVTCVDYCTIQNTTIEPTKNITINGGGIVDIEGKIKGWKKFMWATDTQIKPASGARIG